MKIRPLCFILLCLFPVFANAALPTTEVAQTTKHPAAEQIDTTAVTLAKLDLDGYFLLYLDIEGITHPIREELLTLAAKIDEATEEGSEEKIAISNATDKVDPLLEWLGLYSIRSYGGSLTSIGDRETRSKGFARFDNQIDKTALKRMFGPPSTLPSSNYLPKDTAFATASTFSVKGFWEALKEGVMTFGDESTKRQFEAGIFSMKEEMGIDLDTLLATIDDECMVGFKLDESKPIAIPTQTGESFEIPAPSAIIGLKVSDTSLYDTIHDLLAQTEMPTTELTIGGASAISVQVPISSPVEILPTLMMYDGYLLIASTPAMMEEAVASYTEGPGLVQMEDFQSRMGSIPDEITTFSYVGNRFYSAVAEITKKTITMEQKVDPEDQLLAVVSEELLRVIESRAKMEIAGYSLWNEEGLYAQNNIQADTDNLLFEGIRQPMFVAILGAIQGIQAKRQQEKALGKCMENLSIIDRAKLQWAEDNDYPEEAPTPEDLVPYIEGGFPTCPEGGYYEINELDVPSVCEIHSF